ncbi:MAG: hypothetical protein WC378_09385, partial [Opitutaceae bacterium]
MSIGISNAPTAVMRWAFFVCIIAFGPGLGHASAQSTKRYRPLPEYAQWGQPDQEEGRRALSEFRQLGVTGDYYFEFSLHMIPRRGPERVASGRIWGGKRDGAAIIRLEIRDKAGKEARYLIVGGVNAVAWKWSTGDAAPAKLSAKDLFTPISDTVLTPFDLQMPYLFWKEFLYEGLAKIRERPTHRFLMY